MRHTPRRASMPPAGLDSSPETLRCAQSVRGWRPRTEAAAPQAHANGSLPIRVARNPAALGSYRASFGALDDAQITVGTVPEGAQCLLIPGTVVRGDGLRDAVELDEDSALSKPALVDARGEST